MTRSGLFVGSSRASSGNVRFRASFTPKAIAFSATIPIAVGTAPFHSAAAPSRARRDRLARRTVGNAAGLVCMRTLTVSKGWPV